LVVPACQKDVPIGNVINVVNSLQDAVAVLACTALSTICTPSTNYDVTNAPNAYMYCATDPSDSSLCSTYTQFTAIANAMMLKVGSPEQCGSNTPAPSTGSPSVPCSVATCATSCTESLDQTVTADVEYYIMLIERTLSAVNSVLNQFADCNALIDQVLTFLNICDDLPRAVRLLSAAFGLAVLMSLVSIVVIYRGQKRWIDYDDVQGQSQGSFGGAESYRKLNKDTPAAGVEMGKMVL